RRRVRRIARYCAHHTPTPYAVMSTFPSTVCLLDRVAPRLAQPLRIPSRTEIGPLIARKEKGGGSPCLRPAAGRPSSPRVRIHHRLAGPGRGLVPTPTPRLAHSLARPP